MLIHILLLSDRLHFFHSHALHSLSSQAVLSLAGSPTVCEPAQSPSYSSF